MSRNRFGIAGLLLLMLSITAPAGAQTTERCFPETGYCISGPIRAYWEANGGLAVFGYPITERRTEVVEGTWTGTVQWFERDRLEDHSTEGAGVLAGRLGARWLELQGSPWSRGSAGSSTTNCTAFRETGHSMCGIFREYWLRNGGLMRFGYPITGVLEETVEGTTYAVQYFERRRMELHPEHRGTPYEVLLGLLGREVYTAAGGTVVTPPTGDVAGHTQQAVLDAAYAAVRSNNRQARLAAGLVDIVGDYAAVQVLPVGERTIYVYLRRVASGWEVVEATSVPSSTILRQRGVPEQLMQSSDRSAVIDRGLAQIQDPLGSGLNAYLTRPRIAGTWARLWVVPGTEFGVDPGNWFFRKVGGEWRFETGGSAFPEEQLRGMGVPPELWPHGEGVRGPQS
jgi:hypothetical protein